MSAAARWSAILADAEAKNLPRTASLARRRLAAAVAEERAELVRRTAAINAAARTARQADREGVVS